MLILLVSGTVTFASQALYHIMRAVNDEEKRRASLDDALRYAILGGLSTLLLYAVGPNLASYDRARGDLTTCKANLKKTNTALQMYAEDSEGRFPARLGQLTPNYLLRICPAARQDTCSATYVTDGTVFTMFCQGHHHKRAGAPADSPGYSSRVGSWRAEPGSGTSSPESPPPSEAPVNGPEKGARFGRVHCGLTRSEETRATSTTTPLRSVGGSTTSCQNEPP